MAKPTQRVNGSPDPQPPLSSGQQAPQRDRPPAPPAAPKGQKLTRYVAHSSLRPGVGKLVQRSGHREFCGRMVGDVYGYEEHPNTKAPGKMSTCFIGKALVTLYSGEVIEATQFYVPGTLERQFRAMLAPGRTTGAIGFAVEFWCEPDEEGRPASPLGYSYGTYNLMGEAEHDPVRERAIRLGIIAAPQPQLEYAGADLPDDVDPETGEVRPAADAAAAAAA